MDIDTKVVVLVGGVGGAKLALGLSKVVPPENLTIIVNTGDDFTHLGLSICPDLDTVMYTLSGLVNTQNGWGVADDRFNVLGALKAHYNFEPWFQLGDKDLATHILRTDMLRNGKTLTEVTSYFAHAVGIRAKLLPMANSPIATIIDTVEYGELPFQEYFVKYRWQPTMKGVRYSGAESTAMTDEVRQAICAADVILFGPSNPWLSISPMLAVPGLCDLLVSRNVPRVAVTPIIAGTALKGPAAKLMTELGHEPSAKSVALFYRNVINGFVYDIVDDGFDIEDMLLTRMNTVMKNDLDKEILAHGILSWIQGKRNEFMGDNSS